MGDRATATAWLRQAGEAHERAGATFWLRRTEAALAAGVR